jgi:hypothetical protein
MKKTITLLTGFLLLTIILHAQKKQSKFLIDWAVGPSFPIGKFASTEYKDNDEIPGFAKPGLSTQLSLGYYLNQSIGVMLLSGYTVHPKDEDAYKKKLESYPSNMTVTHMDIKNWKSVKLMAGGFWVTPLTSGSELGLRTKLTAGIAKTAIPEVNWSSTSPSSPPISNVTNVAHDDRTPLPWSFCYQVSVALEYKLSKNLHVLLDITSFNTTAKQEISYMTYPNITHTIKYKHKQATVNALLGIGVLL